jgi:hypothetical protein
MLLFYEIMFRETDYLEIVVVLTIVQSPDFTTALQ